jgi:hypothetical protein
MHPRDLCLNQQPGGPVGLGDHRHLFVRSFGAQNGSHLGVNDLNPPRVDRTLHGLIVPDHFAGTSFFAVQKIALLSIRSKFGSLKSSGWPSDV